MWACVVKWGLQCSELLLEATKSLIGQEISETLLSATHLGPWPGHRMSSSSDTAFRVVGTGGDLSSRLLQPLCPLTEAQHKVPHGFISSSPSFCGGIP